MNYTQNTKRLFHTGLMMSFLIMLPLSLKAQVEKLSSQTAVKGSFSLTDCYIVYDEADYTLVKKTTEMFANDIEAATGIRPNVSSQKAKGKVIIMGTIGKNKMIDKLVANHKLDVSKIKDGWEQFIIQRIANPLPGIDQALVIAGSDRRGVAFGAFTVSEAIGVSAWQWWADVPVKKQDQLYIVNDFVSNSPSVKYRGIFINDEDWGLKPWAAKNYEKDLGDIGPKTYARVCELLLRLKANMLAPAMHNCTGAFYSHPESKLIADEYGIIISTSHCEPLLFNNATNSEWDTKIDGDWNYDTNKDRILKKLDNRVSEAASFENIYTTGMRGIHDQGLMGNPSDNEKVKILTNIIADERNILEKYLKKPAKEVRQIFVPYKETMEIYEMGLQVPEDITLVWVDDNYGYIKRLSNPDEQKRSGGSGVYYHFSYLGPPHDYLWINTTAPVLMYEELKKAYDMGANRYWLVNIGDIKPSELSMQLFFNFAWDVKQFDYTSINQYQSKFLANIFGNKYEKTFQDILDNYYRLAWSRKPEFMGWEREWDMPEYSELANTAFSFENYNDAQQRIADYKRISGLANQIQKEIPKDYRPAFYQMLAFPVMGSYQMNRKFLMAQLNHEKAGEKNYAAANWAAKEAKAAFDSISSLINEYNTMLNGKWNGMMMLAPGYNAKYQNMPEVVYTEGTDISPVNIDISENKKKLDACCVIDLQKFKIKNAKDGRTFRLINGIGYDWNAIQLGSAIEVASDPKNLDAAHLEFEFSGVNADSVSVYVYSLPIFPIYKSKSNQYGFSVDGQPPFVTENKPKEFSKQWRDQVLQNGVLAKAVFPVKKDAKTHTLILTCGDPGTIIERVIIDWGGFKKCYVGPGLN